MKVIFTLATAFLLLFCKAITPPKMAAGDAPVTPQQAAAVKPSSANHMVYDAQRRQMVLLTAPRQAEREEMWGWDGKQWLFIPSTGPAVRELSGATYDARRKRVVLYGGMGLQTREDRRGDTWEWDGKTWQQMTDTSVGTRDHHALAYDEARGKTVMFGGNKAGELLETDTWEWDGAKWMRVATQGPGGRAHFALVYDSKHKQVVLFGGLGEGYKTHNDTWAWDGKIWRKLSEEGPPRRTHHRMAFDNQAGAIVLFGGLAGGNPKAALDDTWIWDGARWKEIKTAGPGKRSGHVMAYDAARGITMLYGGGSWDGKVVTRYDDTWEWDGQQWAQVK
jgi:hypothetical protein